MMFGWREVYTSLTMSDFAKAREALGQKGIRYYYRSKNTFGNSRGHTGSLGINMDYAYQYYLYVKKKDYEQAQYLIGKAR
jgi:hypothetical protein